MDSSCKTQKDECFLERIQHGEAEFPFRFYRENVWEFDFHRIEWHWHPEVEFVYVEKGEISCFIGTEQFILPQGCGLFVNGGVLHRYEAAESVSVPNIVFSPELLGEKSGRIYRKFVDPIVESELTFILFYPSSIGSVRSCSAFCIFFICRKQMPVPKCRQSLLFSNYGGNYSCTRKPNASRKQATKDAGRNCK